MLIIVCGVVGIMMIGVRLMDYTRFKEAVKVFEKNHPNAVWKNYHQIRIIIFSVIALLTAVIFVISEKTENNISVYTLLFLLMLSEILNSLTNYRLLMSDNSVLVKDKVVRFKSIKSLSKPKLAGMCELKMLNGDTIRVPNPCYKELKTKFKG